jgi:glutamate 5-kinase
MQINKAKKIIIKLGSTTIVDSKGKFKKKWLLSLIQDIKKLRKNNQEVVIVSSGSIALGQSYLKIKNKKVKLEMSQAVASVGQIQLMNFKNFLKKIKLKLVKS